jgi:hypothetical protein
MSDKSLDLCQHLTYWESKGVPEFILGFFANGRYRLPIADIGVRQTIRVCPCHYQISQGLGRILVGHMVIVQGMYQLLLLQFIVP